VSATLPIDKNRTVEVSLASDDSKSKLIASCPDCIKVLDLEARLLFMNDGGMEALEIRDFETVRNKSWIDFWEGAERELARAAVETARQGGIGRFVGYFPTARTQQPRWWDVVVSPIPDSQGTPERLLAVSRDVTDQHLAEEMLQSLLVGTASATGGDFFASLVQHLSSALRVRYVFLTECEDQKHAHSLAFWNGDHLGENFEYEIAGTPCESVLHGDVCHYEKQLTTLFPLDLGLAEWKAESFLGAPILDEAGNVIGHIAVLDDKPMARNARAIDLLTIFASRAAAEIKRQRSRAELQAALRRVQMLEARNRIVLEINNAIISNLTQDALFQAISEALHRVLSFDRSAVFLHDPAKNVLRLYVAETKAVPSPHFVTGWEIPAADSPAGWVFQNQRPLLRQDMSVERKYEIEDLMLRQGFRSLAIVPLIVRGKSIGTLNLASVNPSQYSAEDVDLLTEVANQIALAIENMRAYDYLLRQHEASEERFRDLFDEAPIAYVHEGLDSKFIRANRTAMRALGIRPEDVPTTYGKNFVPDTPDAQRRLREAFESIGKGTDTSGVVLELQRRDNGKPLWIQWWSRPDPTGTYTRTMFVDITERVLMEQEKARLEAQNIYLQEEIQTEHNFEEIVGSHPALLELLRRVETVAPTDSTVLILGETGSGKELIARAIHNRSKRRNRPLVKVNCGAIPTGLVESELFGHMRGAFTGALERRVGRFELADGGTLFLDEVSELPLDTQVKLLRVLQEHEFEPLGSSRSVRVNVRIIAASNRDMEVAVREGRFRADLYYRLNVLPMSLPPLRQRRSDIRLLTAFFVERFSREFGKQITGISSETLELLTRYDWPGNIRELQNVIERAVVLCNGSVLNLGSDLLPVSKSDSPDRPAAAGQPPSEKLVEEAAPYSSLEEVERNHILDVLKHARWIIEGSGGAAKILDLHPNTLRSRMKKLGIERASQ
jgi:PAS domain S-box-containing protein